jgi:hypothetical protein
VGARLGSRQVALNFEMAISCMGKESFDLFRPGPRSYLKTGKSRRTLDHILFSERD